VLPGDDAAGAFVPRVTVCAAALQFKVVHAVQAATRALHLHGLVDNRAQAAIARHLATNADPADWADAAFRELRGELMRFGIDVERLDFTQRGTGVALKNISDWSYGDNAAGTRPKA
jgi:hypothetical protein